MIFQAMAYSKLRKKELGGTGRGGAEQWEKNNN